MVLEPNVRVMATLLRECIEKTESSDHRAEHRVEVSDAIPVEGVAAPPANDTIQAVMRNGSRTKMPDAWG
jgi:hypothetical protein